MKGRLPDSTLLPECLHRLSCPGHTAPVCHSCWVAWCAEKKPLDTGPRPYRPGGQQPNGPGAGPEAGAVVPQGNGFGAALNHLPQLVSEADPWIPCGVMRRDGDVIITQSKAGGTPPRLA